MAGKVTTRAKSVRKIGEFVCGNPFHFDWGLKEGGTKASSVRSCILDVLSDLGGRQVKSICRSCRSLCDSRKEVTGHKFYNAVSTPVELCLSKKIKLQLPFD